MNAKNELFFKNREQWHEWLSENHEKANEIWIIYYKKHPTSPRLRRRGARKLTISYDDAVEEALAFGWIDSTVNTIDSERYKQRFIPRRKGSVWSETNLNRVYPALCY